MFLYRQYITIQLVFSSRNRLIMEASVILKRREIMHRRTYYKEIVHDNSSEIPPSGLA